jgi:hypothetical protein
MDTGGRFTTNGDRMIRKTILALGALVLAATAAPARAEQATTSLFENYVDLFGAGTFHEQRDGGKRGTFLVGGEYLRHTLPLPGVFEIDTQFYRGAVGYAQDRWQIGASFGNVDLELDPVGLDNDEFVWTIHGKYVVWRGKDGKTHVSLAASYQDFESDFNRVDVVGILEHAFTPEISATANIGYGLVEPDGSGSDVDDLVAGIGVTFVPRSAPRWRFSAEYVFDNDVNLLSGTSGGDQWNVKLGYRASKNILIYVGGGQHDRYLGGVRALFN